MSVDMKVKAIYDSEISNITRSEKNWKDVLKVAGQLYRYEFDNIVMVTAQRSPEKSTLMADYDTWKKVGRYVKRGAKGCAIFPSRALNPRMRYIFDISDTGGKNVKLTWDLEGENLKSYADFLVSEGQMERYKSDDRESLKNTLKQFTGTNVWNIIKEEFGDRMSELMQLSGSVIKEFNEKRKGLQQDSDMEQLVYSSVMYAVGTRCGFDLSVQEQDFSQIVNIKDEEIVYRLGSLVCDVSCSVLREFSRNLQTIESERRISYVRSNDLQGSGRTAVSGADNAGRDRGFNEAGQIRENGNEVSSGERTGKVQDTDEIWEDVREDVGSRGGSKPALRSVGGTVSNEAQATESVIDNGDVEDKRAGEDAGRGSSAPPDRDEVSLETQEELNRELDEINSLGVSKEAEYTQASFFFDQNGQASFGVKQPEKTRHNEFMRQFEEDKKAALARKYNYLNPKKAESVPSEYVKEILMKGTGFVGGKGRVCEIYQTEIDAGTRAKRIKAEYGQGGASWPLDGLGLHGYDTFHGSGLRIQWKDEDGEVEGYVSWKNVEKEIGVLILTGEYQSETPRIDELAMDGLREDDEVIDAEYREVDTQEEKSEIDDYAIPDEPDSYAVNRKAAELRYIKPIDYADRVAAMDKDLRDAIEILVSECSCYTPFRAFLMDVVQSDFAFMPNKLELICEIAMGNVQGERKAYCNNQYGLTEYTLSSADVKVSYKNRNGERAGDTVSWREVYEILSYAFYTSPEIAACINSALVQFGFKGGNVLEPSMGIGNFFGSMPAPMQQSRLYGVELDSISGRIAKQLYQNANISITGFENTTYPDNFFDVVMGNVPFGDYKIFDPKYNKYNFRIHDYFLAKALDQARPGGMVAVITTKGTLDKSNPTIRKYLAERAELVGAIRLPNTAFKDNAGTEVTADILFLQKRERKIDIEPDWVHLGVTGDGIAVNSYFAEHPEMMLGTMQYDTRMFGQDSKYTVCVNNDENFNLYEALNKAISNIKAQMTDFERLAENEEQTEEVIPADPDVRNYTYTFFEGKLYYRENSEMVRQKVSPTAEERIKSLDEIRQITRELIDIQMEGCSDEELADKQQLLNVKYDKFVGKYGAITSKANRTAFRDDSDYPLLCSLEEVNEDGEVKKADMFYKQTIKAKSVVDRVETAVEALNVSVNEFGYVNIPYMLSIYEADRDTLIKELDGIIFLNPDRYNENNQDAGWETADEYLSGNVRDKLRVAKAMAADTDNPQAERFAANAAALEKVQPEWIEASDIDVKIGTTWIEPLDYEQFIYELLNTPKRARAIRTEYYNSGIQVHLNKMSMEWFIENKSMCEMYVMQLYLQKSALEEMGIHHFDSWAANFGEVTTALELTVEGSGFRFKSRFNKFTNLPELMNIFREVADVQTADMLDLDVPALRGGKPIIVESEPDWYVKQVMEEFVVRAERIRGGGVDPSVDNFLKITHEARLLGTDARLIDKDAPNNPDGKLNKVAENVWKEYVKGNADGHIGCQLIFSDIGTPGPDKDFTIYDYLKESLIKYGIPAEEIAFIHDAKTDAQRDALFKEMRTGKKKVLIGSTDKCGTGVNVQTHLVAMHHVDCPWKPSSIEQREGRGIRQGNKNDEVAIYRYVTKQTFDAYNWSLVENKQRFISQVMTSKAVSRSCEDIDEATLSYAEIKAVATGNPLIREKMEVDNDVQRLKLLKASYDNQRYGLQDNFMIKYPKLIKTATEKLANVREDIKARDKELIDNPDFAITIGNATYTERVDGGTVMLEAISKCKTGETTPVGKFHGFELLVEKNFLSINYMVLRGKTEYKAELSTSPVGSMVKLENLFNGLHENVDFLEKKIEQYQNDLEASKAEYDKPFAYSAELEEKLARQYELNAQLDLENAKAMDADLGGPDKEKSEDRIENAGIVAEDKGIYMPDRNRKR